MTALIRQVRQTVNDPLDSHEKRKNPHRLQAPVWPSNAFKAPIMGQRTLFLWQNLLTVQICSNDGDIPMYSAPDSIGVFDLRNGRVVHMTLPSPDANVFAAAVDGTRGRVVVTGRRILTIIDARNGGTLRTLRTESNNETVTIDPATGTAYVSGVRPHPTTVYDSRWFQWVPWRPAYHDVPPTGVVTIIDTGSLR